MIKRDFKLIIGLGNPDKKYANTYHNVGFLLADFLKPHTPYPIPYTLLKSEVFMNQSGSFVLKALKQNNAKPDELLIIHDDSDIELGKYKLSFGRGAAGHHGVESIISALKTKNFWRLRIGVRSPKETMRKKADEFVLKKISKADKALLEKTFEEIAEKLKMIN